LLVSFFLKKQINSEVEKIILSEFGVLFLLLPSWALWPFIFVWRGEGGAFVPYCVLHFCCLPLVNYGAIWRDVCTADVWWLHCIKEEAISIWNVIM